jgi:preprotein translocase subunit SecA
VEEYTAGDFVEDWDVEGLSRRIEEIFIPSDDFDWPEAGRTDREDLISRLQEEALIQYERREEEFGEEAMRWLERFLLLELIDQRWQEHLYDMDYLQHGIGLRGVAQIDPLVAYKNEAFELFRDLMNSIWSDFARLIYHVELSVHDAAGNPVPLQDARRSGSSSSSSATGGGRVTYSGGQNAAGAVAMAAAAGSQPEEGYDEEQGEPVQQRRVEESEQIGRNDPCWCGSGKKYKKCHGA